MSTRKGHRPKPMTFKLKCKVEISCRNICGKNNYLTERRAEIFYEIISVNSGRKKHKLGCACHTYFTKLCLNRLCKLDVSLCIGVNCICGNAVPTAVKNPACVNNVNILRLFFSIFYNRIIDSLRCLIVRLSRKIKCP